jgi:uncharacterized RDD family membrane protein YckC
MTMSQGPWGSDGGEVPTHPLDELWYLQGEAEAQGPYKGHVLKEMIEAGSIGAASLVAKVGATQWTAVADVPAFAACLPAGGRAPLKFAGFWMRLLAYVIDVILVYILSFVAGLVLGVVFIAAGVDGSSSAMQAIIVLVAIAVALFYYIYFLSGSWQATPGKRICGIHIIRVDGRRVTGPLALGRYLSYLISSLPLGIGFLMVAFTEQKKGLHDIICGTRVVYGKL